MTVSRTNSYTRFNIGRSRVHDGHARQHVRPVDALAHGCLRFRQVHARVDPNRLHQVITDQGLHGQPGLHCQCNRIRQVIFTLWRRL